jgi:hypothetical protein
MNWFHLLNLAATGAAFLPILLTIILYLIRALQALERWRDSRRRVMHDLHLYKREWGKASETGRVRPRGSEAVPSGTRLFAKGRMPRPSISNGLLGLAIRRLPGEMTAEERCRWTEEMKADMGSVRNRVARLLYAFNLWRRGVPAMPPQMGSSAPRRASK